MRLTLVAWGLAPVLVRLTTVLESPPSTITVVVSIGWEVGIFFLGLGLLLGVVATSLDSLIGAGVSTGIGVTTSTILSSWFSRLLVWEIICSKSFW